jgi:hypothetical protein
MRLGRPAEGILNFPFMLPPIEITLTVIKSPNPIQKNLGLEGQDQESEEEQPELNQNFYPMPQPEPRKNDATPQHSCQLCAPEASTDFVTLKCFCCCQPHSPAWNMARAAILPYD